MRPYPYPYRAMLAISSDLDDTPSAAEYLELLRFFNTRENTTFGQGVGLEFAQSIYFSESDSAFSYLNAPESMRGRIDELIESGHIDTLHSYGTRIQDRASIQRCLERLYRLKARIPVWVDHARAPSNFGQFTTPGVGDVPGAPPYHADLTAAYGMDHCWIGQVTTIVGQNTPLTPRALFDVAPPRLASAKRSLKQCAKLLLSATRHEKYSLHAPNRVFSPWTLRDGTEVFQFLRCNPFPRGIPPGDSADRLADNLSRRNLDQLVQRSGVMILYTHLGRRFPKLNTPAYDQLRQALEYASDLQMRGELLVTSTCRALDYLIAASTLRVRTVSAAGVDEIVLDFDSDPRSTSRIWQRRGGEGITVYCDPIKPCVVRGPDGRRLPAKRNPPDETGRPSMTVPLAPLSFPDRGLRL